MYQLIIENNQAKGPFWLIKIAKKLKLKDGSYIFDEGSGDFTQIFEDFKSRTRIKLLVFDSETCIFNDFQQAKHYGFLQEFSLKTTEIQGTIIQAYPFAGSLVLGFDYFVGINEFSDKGLRPEERYFRLKIKQKQEEERLKSEIEKQKTVEGRIKLILQTTGAEYVSHFEVNNKIVVNWKFRHFQINSLVNRDLSIIETGYCVSGFDSVLNLTSAVLLLQTYLDQGDYIHKTRHQE